MTVTAQPSLAEYLAGILHDITPLRALQLALLEAAGGVLADDVRAPRPVPAYDTALLSGYAVSVDSVRDADVGNPVRLSVIGDIGPDEWQPSRLTPGGCFGITAGAPVPAGADAVIPADWTDQAMVTLSVLRPARRGQGIARAGSEFPPDAVLAEAGQEVTPAALGMLAAAGFDHVPARPRPRLVAFGVGEEAAHPGSPGTVGRLVDSASYAVVAAARKAGAQAFRLAAVGDDPERLALTLDDNAMRADLLVVSGLDVADVITRVCPQVTFTRLPILPGGVFGFGRVGDEDTPLVCLPGDPAAAYVGFELLARPIVRRLAGFEQVFRRSVKAHLADAVESTAGVREFVPAVVNERRGGGFTVRTLPHAPFSLAGWVHANGLAVVGDQLAGAPAGTVVDVLMLDG